MELQFDKEIDALLRKARDSEGLGKAAGTHIDADGLAAFAENAVPQAMRRVYNEHLADCSRCRKLLSQAVVINDAVVAAEPAAVVAPVEAAVAPWYAGLFKLPKLAMSMGALVILFAGVLTVLVIQNRRAEQNSAVSQMTETGRQPSMPSTAEAPAAANANAAVSMNTSSSTTAANTAPANGVTTGTDTAGVAVDSVANTSGYGAPVGGKPADAFKEDKSLSLDAAKPQAQPEASAAEPRSAGAGAPPPPPIVSRQAEALPLSGRAVADEKDKKAEERQETESRKMAAKSVDTDDRFRRDAPAPAAKSGPARMGPLQSQSNQVNTNAGEMAVTRKAGNKTFVNKNGAWYDQAYSGQRTLNYRRGSAEYEKLDKGIRSIGNSIEGTVVLVWNKKAYRID